jgi:hypothetical protein
MATKLSTVKEYKATLDLSKELSSLDSQRTQNQTLISERQKIINELLNNSTKLTGQQKDYLKELVTEQDKAIAKEKEINTQLEKQRKNREQIVGLAKSLGNTIKEGWKFLQESDKTIKGTILSLGMSGAKADLMRKSFEQSATFVARLGGSLADVQTIQQGFADETGRARAMTASMVEDITLIGKGTGLGIEQATKLGAQFEFMGLDAKRSMDYVQGIVDTSERMGINTTKVLKNVSDNFKKLNTYSFTSGVKGMAKMAEDAEKFQVSMDTALSAADAAKGLEKAIDLAANLQVMGGEFAKTDPFEWMYLARNEPEKLTQKISEMTRGLVTFKKNSEGVFEKFISPADRQRLEAVGKAIGKTAEEMVIITQRRADLDKMNQQLAGTGLSGREKELVEGAAIFNAKSGKFQVELAGSMKDISSLTSTQAKSFEQEQKTLEDRAKQAMTFDQTLKSIIEMLKASLLPLLNGINIMLKPVAKLADVIEKSGMGMAGAAAILITAGLLWKGVTNKLSNVVSEWVQKSGGKGIAGTAAGQAESTIAEKGTKGLSGLAEQRRGIGQGAAAAGKGKMFAGAGAGIGMAAAGAGAGIGAAAAGISLLANALNKLDTKKVEALQGIVRSISLVVAIGAAAAAAVMIFGQAALFSAPGLGAFSLAVLGIGAGIGIAAAGIGVMGLGLAKMIDSAKGAGTALGTVALGVTEIGLAMASTGVASIFGGGAMVVGLRQISKQAPAIAAVGEAFKEINMVLSGSKEDFVAIQNAISAIANTNVNSGGAFGQLAALLKTPLKVQFDNKEMTIASNITLNIDGQRFMNKIFKNKVAVTHQEELRTQSVNQ